MKFAVIDFETTGPSTDDAIIQVGLVVIDNRKITDRYTSLVNPGICIPSSITGLTGITDEMVEHAPDVSDVMAELYPRIHDCVLVAHNIAFDFGFLQRGLSKAGYFPFGGRLLDTIDLLKALFPSLNSYQLSLASQSFDIEHDRPHQADSDAEATAKLLIRCLNRLDELPLITIQRLHLLLEQQHGNDIGWFLSEIRRDRELHISEDPDTNQYYRGFALKVKDWNETREDENEERDLPETFEQFYTTFKSTMKDKLDHYEVREAQETMINEVHSALSDSHHLMIEAGTGTGKSMGYLIPSLYYGIKNNHKIVVSTHTINLQEQLRTRDVPMLRELFPVPFEAAVFKGRGHYLCLRKFEARVGALDLDGSRDDAMTASQMTVWLNETESGDDEELNLTGRGINFWHSVASDADSCLNRKCPWFRKCFYHRARNAANEADLVITNHSMLFTDIKADHRILPGYNHLILDESHHLEEVASKHLGSELHYFTLVGAIQWLFKDLRNGQLPLVRTKLANFGGDERATSWCESIDLLYPKLMSLREQWDTLCDRMYELVSTGSKDASQQDTGQYVLRLKVDELPREWASVFDLYEQLHEDLGDMHKALERLFNKLKEYQDEYELQDFVTDFNGYVKEIAQCRDNLQFFMEMKDNSFVYWIEGGMNNKKSSISLNAVPIDVSRLLQEYVFDKKESVVMTSATLSVDKSFQFTASQLGFPENNYEQAKLRTVMLPSPFRYREQALVCVPRDFPGIKGISGEALFLDKLIASLLEVALATRGRLLVLFTSNKMLKQVHSELRDRLKPYGIGVLGQGVDSGNRSKLTRLFQEGKANVLLGTSSFWEGVDIPGDALTCLAIVRLPFQPPSHPLVEAKCDNLKKQNKNAFMKFSVPQAVIRFKQGFGRLIRSSRDKGVVIIYDTRVIETRYGRNFLYSLPGPKIESMYTSQIVPSIQQWMGEDLLEVDENI